MNVVDGNQYPGCRDDHPAETGHKAVLNRSQIGAHRSDLGADRGDFRLEFRTHVGDVSAEFRTCGSDVGFGRDMVVDGLEDLCRDVLCGGAADAAIFESMREGQPIGQAVLPVSSATTDRVAARRICDADFSRRAVSNARRHRFSNIVATPFGVKSCEADEGEMWS
jgi:hypothetical protein